MSYAIITDFFNKNKMRVLGINDCEYDEIYPNNDHIKHREEYEKLNPKPKKFKCNCIEWYRYVYQILVTNIYNYDDFDIPDAQLYEYSFTVHDLDYPDCGNDIFMERHANNLKMQDFSIINNITQFGNKKILYKFGLIKN